MKTGLLTRLIAYLSVCMLAAAFGALVGPTWCQRWALFGAFGLASAVGLDVVGRFRARRADRIRNQRLVMRIARRLDEMMSVMEASDAIRVALRQSRRGVRGLMVQDGGGQVEARLSVDTAVTIRRMFRRPGNAGYRLGEPLPGRVQSISRNGFGMAHDRGLERGLVLLEFKPEDGEGLRFIADVLWCKLQDSGGYFSGGKILELVDPSDARLVQKPA